MGLIAKTCFPATKQAVDRLHVQKLAYDAFQEMRIKARWETPDREAIDVHLAKTKGEIYSAPVFENGDSFK
ncbi:MAG: transposase [Proteiniphilum sp.]|nr:transposase [Proteiniphilum sp.]